MREARPAAMANPVRKVRRLVLRKRKDAQRNGNHHSTRVEDGVDGAAGRSEFQVSTMHFQLPSACFFQLSNELIFDQATGSGRPIAERSLPAIEIRQIAAACDSRASARDR
jgi:hypothetical protein